MVTAEAMNEWQRKKNPTACNCERWGRNREEADLIQSYAVVVTKLESPKTSPTGSDINLSDNVFDLIKFHPRVQLLRKNFEKSRPDVKTPSNVILPITTGEPAHTDNSPVKEWDAQHAVNKRMFSVPVAMCLPVEKSAPFINSRVGRNDWLTVRVK